MAQQKLKLMISSRSDRSEIPDGAGAMMKLRDAREQLKAAIEAAGFLGDGLVQVWINETEAGDFDDNAWDECVAQAVECDLFISLYDGSAGWPGKGRSIGICEAEYNAALTTAPSKVKVVRLPGAKLKSGDTRDESFAQTLVKQARFELHVKKDWPELRERVLGLVREMVLKAAHEGAREYRKSGANVGLALDWSRMSFAERAEAIRVTIAGALVSDGAMAAGALGAGLAVLPLGVEEVLFSCHGAPRSLALSASRELVGQPFLKDHLLLQNVGPDVVGPIHLIGCPKGVTESQAVSLLGFPDFTVVEGGFGVYAADRVQKIQLCLLANCADPGKTRNAVTRFFEWLDRAGELPLMIERAISRRRIIDVVLAEA